MPDLSALDGAARQTRLNLRWEATDPNDDELEFTLKVKKEGWPDWLKLTETPITEKTFNWDTTAFPSGQYRLKLIAGDRPSNSPDDALSREFESPTFIVDHDPPAVRVAAKGKGAVVTLSDALTRLVKAEYALDGGAWIPRFSRRRPVRHRPRNDHDRSARPQARAACADGARDRFGGECRVERRAA